MIQTSYVEYRGPGYLNKRIDMDLDASKKWILINLLCLLDIKSASRYQIPNGSIRYFNNRTELFDGRKWVKIA